jgi:hypothetical protein
MKISQRARRMKRIKKSNYYDYRKLQTLRKLNGMVKKITPKIKCMRILSFNCRYSFGKGKCKSGKMYLKIGTGPY